MSHTNERVGAMTRLIQREPVAFQGFVQATLATLVGFGVVNWSSEQVGLVLGAVAAFLALFTRAKVTPTNVKAPVPTQPPPTQPPPTQAQPGDRTATG